MITSEQGRAYIYFARETPERTSKGILVLNGNTVTWLSSINREVFSSRTAGNKLNKAWYDTGLLAEMQFTDF